MAVSKELFGIDKSRAAELGWEYGLSRAQSAGRVHIALERREIRSLTAGFELIQLKTVLFGAAPRHSRA